MALVSQRKEKLLNEEEQFFNRASKFASARLSRGSVRVQNGAFASQAEWEKRKEEHARKLEHVNKIFG